MVHFLATSLAEEKSHVRKLGHVTYMDLVMLLEV